MRVLQVRRLQTGFFTTFVAEYLSMQHDVGNQKRQDY